MKRLIKNISKFVCVIAIASLLPLTFSNVTSAYRAVEYAAQNNWREGSLIALNESGRPVLASLDNINFIGVVASKDQSTANVADEADNIPVLVTDENGDIKEGQKIGLSDVAGVASKWQSGQKLVGIVTANPITWSEASTTVDNKKGSFARVSMVNVKLTNDGGLSSQSNSSFLVALQETAGNMVGHSVSVWQVVAALVFGAGGLLLSLGLLFVSSRESFFSIGRNPMAGSTLLRGLWRMSAIAVVMMSLSLASSYLILRIN